MPNCGPNLHTPQVIHCECDYETKLAEYGIDGNGKLFVHLKVFKQGRVFGEMVATSGMVHLRCRDCGRWTKIRIHDDVKYAPSADPRL